MHVRHCSGERQFNFPHRFRDLPADQVHLADLGDALGSNLQLPAGQNAAEYTACIGKRNDDDIARIRDLIAEQNPHDPQLHFLDSLVVDHRVAPVVKHPHEAVILPSQNTALDETGKGAFLDLTAMGGRLVDPVAGVVRLRGLRDAGKRRIEQIILKRCRVDHEEPLRIGVNSALQGQIHQNRAGKRALPRRRPCVNEPPALVIEQKQHDLFSKPQHTHCLPIQGRKRKLRLATIAYRITATSTTLNEKMPRALEGIVELTGFLEHSTTARLADRLRRRARRDRNDRPRPLGSHHRVRRTGGLAYFATGRQEKGAWVRFGLYGAAMMICAASIWMEIVRPVLEASSFPGFVDRLTRLSGYELGLIAVPPVGFAISFMLWFEILIDSFKYLQSGNRRQRAESDLYGRSKLLGRRFLRRLAKRRGILLGQWGAGRNAKLIGWSLEGSAITVAPPRVGKGALIALNLLSPGDRGFQGSTVTIDPRGELWCIAARRRRELGRRVLLIDPFRVVRGHKKFKETHLPDVESASYNPLDFIRDDESLAVRDINVLLDALLTPPRPDAHNNSRHFYESARAIVAGYMAWVRFQELPELCNLAKVYEMLSMSPKQRETFADRVRDTDRFAGGLTHIAIERQAQVGKEEGGRNFTTVANQLAFLNYPELRTHTQTSSFDPQILADGDTDLFVVAPEETIEHVKGWLRLWVAIPNAVAGIKPLERDLLIVIDEMPRLGYLKPVMDGYTMAAGKGVHFWCFAQSISALDSTWGKEHRKTLLHLAELVQILGFPRTDAEGAEELSKAIGTATFEARTENRSGTIAENRIVTANTQWQAGESRALVRERLITPDELMTMAPDRQYIIASPKDMPRDALHLHHARYWRRWDSRNLADPNPFVIRKERAAEGYEKRVWPELPLFKRKEIS